MKYLIRVAANEACWIASGEGDPARTLVKDSAEKFDTMDSASLSLCQLAKLYPNRAFFVEPMQESVDKRKLLLDVPLAVDDALIAHHEEQVRNIKARKRALIHDNLDVYSPIQPGELIYVMEEKGYRDQVVQWAKVEVMEVRIEDFPNRWSVDVKLLELMNGVDEKFPVGRVLNYKLVVGGRNWSKFLPQDLYV